jgi:hypothetical protein
MESLVGDREKDIVIDKRYKISFVTKLQLVLMIDREPF